MTLQPGSQLNHYQVTGQLGEGGMGQVYRAQDTRLRRDVALKVLPPEVSADPERLARLEREAQALAALNHPHVAAIYGLEEAVDAAGERQRFLAMELVDGETLSDRIQGRPMAPDAVIAVARQIADGLEAAHEKGIVHRDLKPANVMISAEGTAKVLDFGLAKAFEPDGSESSPELSASPTVMGTQAGVILGTASYMAPEQARGQAVDKRVDIWAFGCVLFEMLGGRKPFDGETVTDIIAAVVRAEPDVDELPAGTPPRLRELVRRCLVKDPRERLRDIGDARIELERVNDDPMPEIAAAGSATPTVRPGLLAVAAVGGLLVGALAVSALSPSAPAPPVRQVMLGATGVIPNGLAIAPGGDAVVFRGRDGLRLRWLAESGDTLLDGTANAQTPRFGPDGLLYLSRGNALLRTDIRTGASVTVAEAEEGNWGFLVPAANGSIYALAGTPETGMAVDAIDPETGVIEAVVELTLEDGLFLPVQALDGDRLLGMGISAENAFGGAPELSDFVVELLDLDTGARTVLASGYAWPRYLASGELLLVDEDWRLMSVQVDPDTLALSGVPVPRIEGLANIVFFAAYDVSDDGSVVYVAGESSGANERNLYWVERDGGTTLVTDKVQYYDTDTTISPDGRYLAVERTDVRQIWIHDLERDTQTPVWSDGISSFPVWSPDGRFLAVSGFPVDEPQGIFLLAVDRSQPPRRLSSAEPASFHLPMDWSVDGTIVYVESDNQTRGGSRQDLWLVDADGESESRALLTTAAKEVEARFSPDGHWVAYVSDHSGSNEVYVRAADGSGGEIPISADGGNEPSWNRGGGELFYIAGRRLMAVPVATDGAFSAGVARELLTLPDGYLGSMLEPDLEGQRFLAVRPVASQVETRLEAIFNWTQTLRR